MFDNSLALVNFLEPANKLNIVSDVVIQHYEDTPLNFCVEDYALNFPFGYKDSERMDLATFQQPVFDHDQSLV